MSPETPWRIRDFRTLFTATALAQLGTNIGYVALPLIAVTALDASAGQVGALATLSTLAFLLIGLPAGAWVDRMRHRRVLVVADLVKAALYASVPLAWWLGGLTLWQLYAVALLSGCATVFFDVASQSVLPQLVGRGHLVQANAAVVSLMAVGSIAGRSAGGALVQLLTAPVAIAATAASHLGSALRLIALRRTPAPAPPPVRGDGPDAGRPGGSTPGGSTPGLGAQIAEGLRHVLGNAELRALALTASVTNLGFQTVNTLLPVLFVRELHLPAGALGLYWAVGGLGILLGSRCARPVAARVGYGRALGLAGLCAAPAGLLVPLNGPGVWLFVAGFGSLVLSFKAGMDNVLGVTLRQRMTPDALLGRMNATFRFLLTGSLAVGAALAGVLGELVGLHPALWLGGALLASAFLPVFLSPIRTRRSLPDQPAGQAEAGTGVHDPAGPPKALDLKRT
ncbi:MFS transporter [Streptomyces sp. CB01881]|uniref:MFS transporter n=1 Tax=Streptomyces sp. CB01881 TaxID=2078691 RepID=UPI000CDC677E|nr:MFS transporter [Streptomyces sp. CB01881]AUY52394.1 MFS transporter [Streptomyces sp. CB01881]TYC71820.1 MFS transporter [Streptomyces sp. CB01881]